MKQIYISAYSNFPYRNLTKSTQTKTLTPESWSVHPVTDAAAAILSMTLAKSSGVTKPGRSSEQKANCKGANLRNRWNFWRIRGPKTWIPGKENHGLSPLTDRGLCFPPFQIAHGLFSNGGCILTTKWDHPPRGLSRWLNVWKQQKAPKTTGWLLQMMI